MESSLVSVIIPTRNRAHYLPQALDSVYAQRYQHFEILLVDDGSTDHTADIAKGYDTRLRYFRQSRKGVSAARNLALSEAKGRYVAFLDDDDWWTPDKLQKQVAYLDAHADCGWITSGFCMVDAEGKPREHGLIVPQHKQVGVHEVALFVFMIPSATMVRTDWLRDVGGFPDGVRISEDYHLWAQLAMRGSGHVLADALTCFRIHSGNTKLPFREHLRQNRKVLDRLFAQVDEKKALALRPMYERNLQRIIRDNLLRDKKYFSYLCFLITERLRRVS